MTSARIATVNHVLNNILQPGKDSLAKDNTRGADNKFSCKNRRCKVNYVGQTKRALRKRIFEHVTHKKFDSVTVKHKS